MKRSKLQWGEELDRLGRHIHYAPTAAGAGSLVITGPWKRSQFDDAGYRLEHWYPSGGAGSEIMTDNHLTHRTLAKAKLEAEKVHAKLERWEAESRARGWDR